MQSLPGTKRKGINNIYWNRRLTPVKSASGGTKADAGGFAAPLVMPGEYTLKLKVGDKDYSDKITLVHDASNKDFSMADREAQYTSAMKLYGMQSELNGLITDVNAEQKLLKENTEKVKSAKAKKVLTDYNTQLETLRATLLGTKQKSIFADEEELRERISEVYRTIIYQESKPSNLQLERVEVLQKQLSDAKAKHEAINKQFGAKVQEAMKKEGIKTPPEVLMDKKSQ